jgi:universal stress protein A
MLPLLVAVDFSELTDTVLERARSLAMGRGQQIDLLHVVGPPKMAARGAAARAIYQQARHEREEAARLEVQQRLDRLPEPVRGKAVIRTGVPSQEIVDVASEGYDMILLATRGRTGLTHTLLGSVAETVVRHAPIPVLVVR